MQNNGKVNNTTIWWLKKIDETNRFKVKTWRGFNLAILKVKQIHYKRIEVFTIRFNSKSIATSSSNLLTWPRSSFESMNSFSSWIYTNTSAFACDFKIQLKGFNNTNCLVFDFKTTFEGLNHQLLLILL